MGTIFGAGLKVADDRKTTLAPTKGLLKTTIQFIGSAVQPSSGWNNRGNNIPVRYLKSLSFVCFSSVEKNYLKGWLVFVSRSALTLKMSNSLQGSGRTCLGSVFMAWLSPGVHYNLLHFCYAIKNIWSSRTILLEAERANCRACYRPTFSGKNEQSLSERATRSCLFEVNFPLKFATSMCRFGGKLKMKVSHGPITPTLATIMRVVIERRRGIVGWRRSWPWINKSCIFHLSLFLSLGSSSIARRILESGGNNYDIGVPKRELLHAVIMCRFLPF